jgi:hypothetical protein
MPGYITQLHPRLQLLAQIDNLLDHHYYTASQFGPTGFTNLGTFVARPLPAVDGHYPIVNATFYAPGAPFGIGAEYGSSSELKPLCARRTGGREPSGSAPGRKCRR